MSGIAGLRGTGDWSADERPKSFRESILWMSPNGDAPIFALTSKAGKKTVTDPEFGWWAETNNLFRLQLNGAVTATDTMFTVDSPDPIATNMTRPYGNASHLKKGDMLLVEKADQTIYDNEMLLVDSVLSDLQFTVTRGAAGTTPAIIADDAFLTLIGSSYAEGTGAPQARSKNPTKFNNYVQIFKDTYELTGTADATTIRTGNAWSNDKKRQMFKHSMGIEFAILFGVRAEQIGENGKPIRFMGGLRYFIPQATPANGGRTTVFAGAANVDTLMDAISPVFDWDGGGGDTRIAFFGNKALIELNKLVRGTTGIRMEMGNTIKVWGMNFRELIMPQGRLLVKAHPLLSRHPRYQSSGFVCDFSTLKYVTMPGRDTKAKDDVQNKDEDVRRGFFQSDASIMIDGGGLSWAYVGNISAT